MKKKAEELKKKQMENLAAYQMRWAATAESERAKRKR